jgi:anthranilate phosphoribosyltransferase
VALNAAAALYVHEDALAFPDALARAREGLAARAGLAALEALRQVSTRAPADR